MLDSKADLDLRNLKINKFFFFFFNNQKVELFGLILLFVFTCVKQILDPQVEAEVPAAAVKRFY